MEKYKDFKTVVGAAPVTDTMLLAARNLSDPAAFIYAAAKTQPKELERIANLTDPLLQAAEVGRLEEKMRKARVAAQAAKPLSQTKGDMGTKEKPKGLSIEDRIAQHAKNRVR